MFHCVCVEEGALAWLLQVLIGRVYRQGVASNVLKSVGIELLFRRMIKAADTHRHVRCSCWFKIQGSDVAGV